MIIFNCEIVTSNDRSVFAWSGLRRFQNVDYVEEQICKLHSLDDGQRQNARKQATQIRHCLTQAKEYFDAASTVTLATKPTLFYYAIMSLALAEILFKQTGESSLDKAREQHRHHGLEFVPRSVSADANDLVSVASALIAKPAMHADGQRFGTFNLWHRSCREMPLVGPLTHQLKAGGATTGHCVLMNGEDKSLELLASEGLNLLECLRALPGLMDWLGNYRVAPRLVRGRLTADSTEGSDTTQFSLTIHPGISEMVEEFFASCDFAKIEGIAITRFPNGGHIKWSVNEEKPAGIFLPHASMWTTKEIRFWPSSAPLNEFGYLYVALHIAGNFARYYPDLWMPNVEKATPLALAIEKLVEVAEQSMALHTLSQLTRTYHVPAA